MKAYHCAPREHRDAIERRGIRVGVTGLVWLWESIAGARSYAAWFDDVWEVDLEGMEHAVRPSGDFHGELVCALDIGPARVKLQ